MTKCLKGKKEMFKLRLATLNVRGIRNKNKRRSIFQWARDKQIDILCLQETHITNDIVK